MYKIKNMKIEEISDEIEKCKNSPYYFATTYLTIKSNNGVIRPYFTSLSEEDFNKEINRFKNKYEQ